MIFARKLTALALAAALIGAAAPPAGAKTGSEEAEPAGGKIAGKVLGVDGKTPVAGAVVTAYPLQGETGNVVSGPSNAKGEFLIAGLPFGYFDLVVESNGSTFIASRVVNVPPEGKVNVQFSLTPYGEKSSSWWAGREQRSLPGGGVASGSAEMQQGAGGSAFWKSPGGIAVIAGVGGLALLAIAGGGGGGGSSTPVSPSTVDGQ